MKHQTKWPLWLSLVSTVIAVGVHMYLTQHHYTLIFGASDSPSICNINQTFSCDTVNTSPFSEFLGKPIALWAALTNTVLALFLFWQLIASATPFLRRLSFYIASFILLGSIVMGVISFTQLGTFCLFCIFAYVLSLLTWIGTFKNLESLDFSLLPSDVKTLFAPGPDGSRTPLVFLLLIPVFTFMADSMAVSSHVKNLDVIITDALNNWKTARVNTFDTSTGLHLRDKAGQYKMTIVEFADFGCPHCKRAAPSLHAFANSRNDVQLIFLNYPLDGACNAAIPREGRTCPLAKSTYCSEQQNKGWAIHDWVFHKQGQADQSNFELASKDLGLDYATLSQCLSSEETTNVIRAQAAQGKSAGIEGTPSIFVNGRQLPAGFFIPILEAAYKNL
ncbi:MAG: vitamin K epoxide reductase family protein [Bdellovibrionales bacterium]